MKKNYLLTIIALLVVQLSLGRSHFYQDNSPPDTFNAERAKAITISNSDQEKEIEGFKMYPNPVTNGFVTITSKRNLTKQIRVYDVLGNEVLGTTLTSNSLNVSSLVPGIYLLKVTEKDQSTTRKLVIR